MNRWQGSCQSKWNWYFPNSQHRIGNQNETSQPHTPNLGLGISPRRHMGTRGHKLHESPAPQPNQTASFTPDELHPKVAITSHFPLRFQIKDWDFATVFRSSWNNFSDAPADDLCLFFFSGWPCLPGGEMKYWNTIELHWTAGCSSAFHCNSTSHNPTKTRRSLPTCQQSVWSDQRWCIQSAWKCLAGHFSNPRWSKRNIQGPNWAQRKESNWWSVGVAMFPWWVQKNPISNVSVQPCWPSVTQTRSKKTWILALNQIGASAWSGKTSLLRVHVLNPWKPDKCPRHPKVCRDKRVFKYLYSTRNFL